MLSAYRFTILSPNCVVLTPLSAILTSECPELVKTVSFLNQDDDKARRSRYNENKIVRMKEEMVMEPTLLLVDDEPKMIEIMAPYLREEGYRVVTATNGKKALAAAQAENPLLVVLDWMLPEMSGLDVCRELRKTSSCGIIMLTAKTEEADKIVGLEIGADDYMTKPFSLRELAARIRSVIRRLQGHHDDKQVMQRGELSISELTCQIWRNEKEIRLTPIEFKMLLTLSKKPGIVFSRLQLLKAAVDEELYIDERTVDSHISNLRKKIEANPSAPQYIQTVYGFGYRFCDRL